MNIDGITVAVHQGDLPSGLRWESAIAIDTETMGLNHQRDRLCLVQVYGGGDTCHLVQMGTHDQHILKDISRSAPNLRSILSNTSITKIFHFARFDVAVIFRSLNLICQPIYCTKISSKLVRTYTDRHGLSDLCLELLGIELSKAQQTSDWGRKDLTQEQIRYAASDVLYLHRLREALDPLLERERRKEIADACFRFLPTRAILDAEGWSDVDIFAH